ncbi:MAG: amidohydrolase family protein [Bryobacterales bacterium]|nr:amidohydrolase family protein [Bryobacterales bacterium]
MIDVNVSLGPWPFRRFPGDTPSDLAARLKRRGVTQAWAGSFEGVFHRDTSAANARLAKACETAGSGFLLPFGSVNPAAPGWREDLRRCHETHHMPGIRLHPNYHGYKLSDAAFADLLKEARDRKLIVQVALNMEDERSHHPLMRIPALDPAPLPEAVAAASGVKLVVLNRMRAPAGEALEGLARAGVHFDLAMIEGAGCAGSLMSIITSRRLLFGSHAPFQYFEAAVLKLKESAITGKDEENILSGNARRLLGAE